MPPTFSNPIHHKRAVDAPGRGDGSRVLVDRMWPRGLPETSIHQWLKDLSPSPDLSRWFRKNPSGRDEFSARYMDELRQKPLEIRMIRELQVKGPVTLIAHSPDSGFNTAVVLKKFLDSND